MSVFDVNVSAVEKKSRSLAEILRKHDAKPVAFERAVSGDLTFKHAGLYFHSKYDPTKEAELQAEEIMKKKFDWLVLGGLGCGHLLKTLFKRGKENIIVFEPSLDIAKGVLGQTDLSAELGSDSVYLCEAIDRVLQVVRARTMGLDDLLSYNTTPYARVFEEIPNCVNRVRNAHVLSVCGVGTEVSSSLEWTLNYFVNIPSFLKYKSVDCLRGFKDVPMVIVGAGPSLKKNAHLLKDLKGRAVIVAAITAYKPMLKYGVVPDFVIAAEKVDLPEYFTYGEDDKKTRLMLADMANPKMFERDVLNKVIFYNRSSSLGTQLSSHFNAKFFPKRGGSVTTVAFDIGVMCGFNPVILVGQDLAYSDGRTHVEDSVYTSQAIDVNKESGTVAIDQKYETIKDNVKTSHKLLWLKDYDGNPIASKFDWVTFHQWFENYMGFMKKFKFPINVVNATEGGAYIEGMEHIPLGEAIRKYIDAAPPMPVAEMLSKVDESGADMDVKGLKADLEKMLKGLKKVRSQARAIVRHSGTLHRMAKKGEAGDKAVALSIKIKEVEAKLFEAAKRAEFIWEPLLAHTYKLQEFHRGETDKDHMVQLKKEIIVVARSYNQVAQMCDAFMPVLESALKHCDNDGVTEVKPEVLA